MAPFDPIQKNGRQEHAGLRRGGENESFRQANGTSLSGETRELTLQYESLRNRGLIPEKIQQFIAMDREGETLLQSIVVKLYQKAPFTFVQRDHEKIEREFFDEATRISEQALKSLGLDQPAPGSPMQANTATLSSISMVLEGLGNREAQIDQLMRDTSASLERRNRAISAGERLTTTKPEAEAGPTILPMTPRDAFPSSSAASAARDRELASLRRETGLISEELNRFERESAIRFIASSVDAALSLSPQRLLSPATWLAKAEETLAPLAARFPSSPRTHALSAGEVSARHEAESPAHAEAAPEPSVETAPSKPKRKFMSVSTKKGAELLMFKRKD